MTPQDDPARALRDILLADMEGRQGFSRYGGDVETRQEWDDKWLATIVEYFTAVRQAAQQAERERIAYDVQEARMEICHQFGLRNEYQDLSEILVKLDKIAPIPTPGGGT